jgi:hypothetical protein
MTQSLNPKFDRESLALLALNEADILAAGRRLKLDSRMPSALIHNALIDRSTVGLVCRLKRIARYDLVASTFLHELTEGRSRTTTRSGGDLVHFIQIALRALILYVMFYFAALSFAYAAVGLPPPILHSRLTIAAIIVD